MTNNNPNQIGDVREALCDLCGHKCLGCGFTPTLDKCKALTQALNSITTMVGGEVDELEKKVTGISEIYCDGDLHINVMEMFDEIRTKLGLPMGEGKGE